jgi:hypothetical protein
LGGTQIALQESEFGSEEICHRSTSSILVDSQIGPTSTWLEDVGDLAEEHQLMEDTSICVLREIDLQLEVDLAVCLGSMMQHASTRDDMSMLRAYNDE